MQNYYKAYLREKAARDEVELLLEEKTSKLYALNVELEKKLTILQQQQIAVVQSEKMATLGTLSAGVAHEINNPLAYLTCNLETFAHYKDDINSYLTLMSRYAEGDLTDEQLIDQLKTLNQGINTRELTEDLEDIANDCQEGCGRISEIIKNLLDFAKPKQSDESIFEVKEVIEHAIKLLENKLKQVHLTSLSEEGLFISGSKSNITQAFINIFVNAVQACEEAKEKGLISQSKITVTVNQTESEYIIEFCDNGIGIPEDDISHIFEPFYSTKPLGEGTGMGLAVVYGILSNHKGSISLVNNIDNGVTVSVKLPKSKQ
ncbi:sensor histidine kinase [Pseudoalteromonas luteoviolacea]|uniref:sensor histidine kinase n=1 Tax=Pseudoalteromonas luteoviolacea TaxID=43657 RepID=UPI00114FBF47|nr:ATP-binding protein [Pseudoalteromonas luteoviolacea]TQF67303.1 GHKL domain-containing protein [Pseudoalteromonas luteoviolacea]